MVYYLMLKLMIISLSWNRHCGKAFSADRSNLNLRMHRAPENSRDVGMKKISDACLYYGVLVILMFYRLFIFQNDSNYLIRKTYFFSLFTDKQYVVLLIINVTLQFLFILTENELVMFCIYVS